MNLVLSMIVKESNTALVRRCLESVKSFIGAWAICDTGSTEVVKRAIHETLKGIPGALIDRPWVDFAHNRNESLQLAREFDPDYFLVMDANKELVAPGGWRFPNLTAPSYHLLLHHGKSILPRLNVLSGRLNWKYECPIHEILDCGEPHQSEEIPVAYLHTHGESLRSQDPDKFVKDAKLLQELAKDKNDPHHMRYLFHLGLCCQDAGAVFANQWDNAQANQYRQDAIDAFETYAAMQHKDQVQRSFANVQIARLRESLQYGQDEVVSAYLHAYNNYPYRPEVLGYLAKYLRGKHRYREAIFYAEIGLGLKDHPTHFIEEPEWKQWRLLDELSLSLMHLGEVEAACGVFSQLLNNPALPEKEQPRIIKNREQLKQWAKV